MDRRHFVLLGKVGDAATARLLAARLDAEGIEARVRSESSGPYVFTVGRMAEAELWVDEADLADAREVMLAAEVDTVLGGAETGGDGTPGRGPGARLVAFAVAAVLLALFAWRFLEVVGR